MSENGKIYTTGKNFTLPPAVTAWTNSTSDQHIIIYIRLLLALENTKLKNNKHYPHSILCIITIRNCINKIIFNVYMGTSPITVLKVS